MAQGGWLLQMSASLQSFPLNNDYPRQKLELIDVAPQVQPDFKNVTHKSASRIHTVFEGELHTLIQLEKL